MTFDYRETSRQDGHPISLYFFRYGEGADDYFAFNSSDIEVDFDHGGVLGVVTYEPRPIDRDGISASGDLDKSTLTLQVSRTNPLAVMLNASPVSYPVTFEIREGHLGDGEFLIAMVGRVLGLTYDGSEASLICEPIQTSMGRNGLRRNYQFPCPHVLYGTRCGANKAAATSVHEVVSVAGPEVTLTPNWVDEATRATFINGTAEWARADDGRKERRTIIRIKDNATIILSGPGSALANGADITLIKGCSHVLELDAEAGTITGDCVDVHDNVQNFGGCLTIPTENPIGAKNPYY